jgi:hypothetical protein
MDWEAYNEGTFLIPIIEKYRERTGYYPDLVQVDSIYLNRENRKYMKEHNIRHIGKPLGRPVKETLTAEQQKVRLEETSERNQDLQVLNGLLKKGHLETVVPERIAPILMFSPSIRFGMEGAFGLGKRRYAESQQFLH